MDVYPIANREAQQEPLHQGRCTPVSSITPEEVRRIIREELERAGKPRSVRYVEIRPGGHPKLGDMP